MSEVLHDFHCRLIHGDDYCSCGAAGIPEGPPPGPIREAWLAVVARNIDAPAPPMAEADALYGRLVPARLRAYLTGGGLFNPELANHDAVRNLIIDSRHLIECQTREIAALRECVRAADAMRAEFGKDPGHWPPAGFTITDYDAARAKVPSAET